MKQASLDVTSLYIILCVNWCYFTTDTVHTPSSRTHTRTYLDIKNFTPQMFQHEFFITLVRACFECLEILGFLGFWYLRKFLLQFPELCLEKFWGLCGGFCLPISTDGGFQVVWHDDDDVIIDARCERYCRQVWLEVLSTDPLTKLRRGLQTGLNLAEVNRSWQKLHMKNSLMPLGYLEFFSVLFSTKLENWTMNNS